MKGATERWVEVTLSNGKTMEVVAYLFRTDREMYANCNRDYDVHPDCVIVEAAVNAKIPLQKCKLFRIMRMEFVGYILPMTEEK